MSDQDNGQVSTLQCPTTDDKEAWKAYWKTQGSPWRTEPEIDEERQKYLAERRSIIPNIEQGIYPFKDIKLNRADVEWLLATHDGGRGPIDWNDESQRERKGLDLRGTLLKHVNLSGLPMARLCGGLCWYQGTRETVEQLESAGVILHRADLRGTHLEDAILRGAHLEDANLEGVFLRKAELSQAYLAEANLRDANLEEVILINAHLEGAKLAHAYLEGADLRRAHLEGSHLLGAHLERADLRRTFFDRATNLQGTFFSNAKDKGVRLAGTHWGDVDLTLVNWEQLNMLGDEGKARQRKKRDGQGKNRSERLREYEYAVRANRQLAVALQAQGLNEEAARFAYRAQKLQRVVLRRQRKFGSYLFSIFLDLLAGYGYRPGRSVIWYLVTIFGFALAYFAIGHVPFFPDAFVFSLTSFHGRGFFPGLGSENSLHNPLVIMAAFEAVVGLLIEISFIATFTQRFFGR